MIAKCFEVRDRSTFIPVMAVKLLPAFDERNGYLIRRAGFGPNGDVYLVRLCDERCAYSPYNWNDGAVRTIREAHRYIEEHFDSLMPGDVVDVEFILGETTVPKTSEKHI